MEILGLLASGFAGALTLVNIMWLCIGSALGTVLGMLPGLGPTTGIALLMPLTFTMKPATALITMCAIYYGAMFGGSRSSILLNVPGDGAAVASCFDGYPMARNGQAEAALAISAIASFIGGLIATIGVLARFHLPESPRWLALHGRLAEADAVVRRMEQGAAARGIALPPPQPTAVSTERHAFPFRALLRPPYGARLALLAAMWFCWYIGNYGFLGDAATLIAAQGFAVGSSLLFLGVGALGYPLGALLMALVADRIERRMLIFASTVVWLVGMLLIGLNSNEAVLILGSFVASLALGLYLQVAYTYTAELFPTRARSSGFALSDGIGHTGGALGALALPGLIGATSFFTGFLGIGLTGLLAGLIALAGPRTSGRRLEEVSS